MLKKAINAITTAAQRNKPEIFLISGIFGFVGTIALTVKATLDVKEVVDNPGFEELTKKEKAITIVPIVLPPTMMFITSVSMVVSAHNIMSSRLSLLNGMLTTSSKALGDVAKEYGEKVILSATNPELKEIKPVVESEDLDDPSLGSGGKKIECYDTWSGRRFRVDTKADIMLMVARLNETMMLEGSVQVSDWFYEIGLLPTDYSDIMGWDVDYGIIGVRFSSALLESGATAIPVLTVTFNNQPRLLQ